MISLTVVEKNALELMKKNVSMIRSIDCELHEINNVLCCNLRLHVTFAGWWQLHIGWSMLFVGCYLVHAGFLLVVVDCWFLIYNNCIVGCVSWLLHAG